MSAEDPTAIELLAGHQELNNRLVLALAEEVIELKAAMYAQQGLFAVAMGCMGSTPAQFKAAVDADRRRLHVEFDTTWKARVVALSGGGIQPDPQDPWWDRPSTDPSSPDNPQPNQ